MMASLRGRLVAGLLGLAAVALLALAGITYYTQRSFLLQRVDQQVRSAPGAVLRAFDDGTIGSLADPDRHDDRGGGPPGDGAPIGTYGERRDASGHVVDRVLLGYASVSARPVLPARMVPGRLITVSGSGTSWRALATQGMPGGGSLVVAVPLGGTEQTLQRLLAVEGVVIAGVLALLGLVTWALVRVGLMPLDRMGHTAGAIAGGDLSHRVATTDPRTEVGRLGIALNAMLDRLESAFAEREASEDRLRRFIADASHELRTPLASIRGYAELYRMGAARAPGDTDRAMRRIEDEAARMGILVEDLLTLARLDQVRAAPHELVDLAALARDAVDDARATAPDRRVELRLDAPAAVLGDVHQLRQVLANLLGNALVHTPAGTAVEVALHREGADAVLEIRDHGPGLPAGEPDALFERFWRAEGGRTRGKGGAGLGLAIVAGIVDAHGGRVAAADAPGGGAAFVVRLPVAVAAPA